MKSQLRLPQLRTPGILAEEIGYPLSRVQYVLRTRRIQPTARAGLLRLFDRQAAERVRQELDSIDARRRRRSVNRSEEQNTEALTARKDGQEVDNVA